MRIFDAQLRTDTRSDDDLKHLAYFDTERVVTTAHAPRTFHTSDALLDYLRTLLDVEVARLRRCGIEAGVAIGVLPAGRPRRAHPEVFREIPRLLTDDRVLAVGEVGAWEDADAHWSLFDRQIALAIEAGLPVIITPPRQLRINMTYKMMARAQKLGLPPGRCMMNLLDERLLSTVLEEGFVGGVAVGRAPLEPKTSAKMIHAVLQAQPESASRILLNSSLRRGAGDILGIPKTLVALGELDLDDACIEGLAFENAERFFVRSDR